MIKLSGDFSEQLFAEVLQKLFATRKARISFIRDEPLLNEAIPLTLNLLWIYAADFSLDLADLAIRILF
jgi:hypothetical protein